MQNKKRLKYLNIYFLGLTTGVLPITIIFLFSNKQHIVLNYLVIAVFSFIILLIIYRVVKYECIFKLEEALEELEKEKMIKESLFQLNHEIKNPLAVVNGYIEMIDKTDSNKKKEKYFKIIKEEIKRSITIINDFSTVGKLKKLNQEPLDLSIILEDIIEIFNPIMKKKNGLIHYDILDELYIMGDYDRLKQVFINILKNSIESQDKDYLIIDIIVKKIKSCYKVSIKDNGKGMNKEELSHIDEAFYSTKQNGTGLGIVYVKKIIEMHNGTLEFKSKEKEGTTVIVTLPLMN